jgi:hypothetical protein
VGGNTVVSNHYHSVKILLFSSVRSRDFDGMYSTGLPVSMYTTKTQIDMCRFNVRSSTWKHVSIFCKTQISIKWLYCIKDFNIETIISLTLNVFSFFFCGCQHHERKTICLYLYISDIRQTVRYQPPVCILLPLLL